MRSVEDLKSRFVSVSSSGCWEWTGARYKRGYGYLSYKNKTTRAHRLFWELHKGAIPKGLSALHRCDNPPCVNPEHLFLGTIADNNADMHAKGRAVIPKGAHQGNSQLTDDKVKMILSDDRLHTEIAKTFGVHRTTVNDIKRGKSWAWLSASPLAPAPK